MALDPKTHRIYLSAVDYAPPAPGAAAGARAQANPDTFRVLRLRARHVVNDSWSVVRSPIS